MDPEMAEVSRTRNQCDRETAETNVISRNTATLETARVPPEATPRGLAPPCEDSGELIALKRADQKRNHNCPLFFTFERNYVSALAHKARE